MQKVIKLLISDHKLGGYNSLKQFEVNHIKKRKILDFQYIQKTTIDKINILVDMV